MALLQRFDPPALLADLDRVPGGRESWDQFVKTCFSWAIDAQRSRVVYRGERPGTVQFYSPSDYDPGGPVVEQAIVWNAFPKELLVRFGRERALVYADRLWPWNAYRNLNYDPLAPGQAAKDRDAVAWYRPQDEYCEWHVDRDPLTGAVRRVTFTSEPPEYWQAIFGGTTIIDDGVSATFPGNRDLALDLYRALIGPNVQPDDLTVKEPFLGMARGDYNPYNKWNTTHGVVHLGAPPNSLAAEIRLGADATVQYRNGRGEAVVDADALVCCASYGGPERNSDPTIGATVNALARAGAMVTLVNPVGLYMDHIDLTGWEPPKGISVQECAKIVRGSPGMIERLVVEPPADSGVSLSDFTIAGEPILYGGQIAECITVKLVGGGTRLGSVHNGLTTCVSRCCLDPHFASRLGGEIPLNVPTPFGQVDAFSANGRIEPSRPMPIDSVVGVRAALWARRAVI
jgi:hypothetical protein